MVSLDLPAHRVMLHDPSLAAFDNDRVPSGIEKPADDGILGNDVGRHGHDLFILRSLDDLFPETGSVVAIHLYDLVPYRLS